MSRDGITASRFQNMRDFQHDEKRTQIKHMSNSMCVQRSVETFHQLKKGLLELPRRKALGGMYVREAVELCRR